MKTRIPVLTLAVAALAPLPAAAEKAAPVPAPKPYFVANCFNCHGTDGRTTAAIPALAGLDKNYFIEQMKAFKLGARQATIMHQLAKGYTDEEVAVAAEYFAQQKK